MKTLYYIYLDGDIGDLFVSEKGEYVGYMHCNDASYCPEYMDFIPEYFGGEVVSLDLDLSDEDYEKLYDNNGGEDIYDKLKKKILKAIKARK